MSSTDPSAQNAAFIQSLSGQGAADVGAKIRAQYPNQVGPGISDDILGAALLNRFPALSPYYSLSSGLGAASQVQGLQQGTQNIQKGAQDIINPSTGLSPAQSAIIKQQQTTDLNTKQLNELWSGYQFYGHGGNTGFVSQLVDPAQQILNIEANKSKMSGGDYQKALNNAALQLNQQLSSGTENFTPAQKEELKSITPIFNTENNNPGVLRSLFPNSYIGTQQVLRDSDQQLAQKARTIIQRYGQPQAVNTKTNGSTPPLSSITNQTYSGQPQSLPEKIGGFVVNHLPAIAGTAGGVISSALVGPEVGIPAGMAIDAGVSGVMGAGGEAAKEKLQGQNLNANKIVGEGALQGITMGLARPVGLVGGKAIDAAAHLPVIGNLIQGLQGISDRAFIRIYGPAIGDQKQRAEQELANIVQQYGINADKSSNPSILYDRMKVAQYNIGEQLDNVLKNTNLTNSSNTPFTYGDLNNIIKSNSTDKASIKLIQSDANKIIGNDPNISSFVGRSRSNKGQYTYIIPNNTPVSASVLNQIKQDWGDAVNWNDKDITTRSYKSVYNAVNNVLKNASGDYEPLNFRYNVARNSAKYIDAEVQRSGNIVNAGQSPRFKLGPMSIPIPMNNIASQQKNIALHQISKQFLPPITAQGSAQLIRSKFDNNSLPPISY